eukprot:127571_1
MSITNGNNEIRAPQRLIYSNTRSRAPSLSPRRRSLARKRRRSSGASSTSYSSAISSEIQSPLQLYDEWILSYEPSHSERGRVIDMMRRTTMEQNSGSRFPLKCCDMVRKSSGDAYLLFGGGAKQYLQAYQVTYNGSNPQEMEWKSLCCTGGNALNRSKKKKNKKKKYKSREKEIEADAIASMDVRIKSVVVVPNPKYLCCWLIVTGDSRGTVRVYTLDEEKPTEFQFEGEDSILHRDNNATSPILSLCSTYSSQTNYHFEGGFQSQISEFDAEQSPINGVRNGKKSRIIPNYLELAPHLIFSGATDGWIRIWFWDVDSHCIQLVKRLAIHQNGVNSISASWLDATYSTHNELKSRRLAIVTGGDDQSMTLIIGDLDQTAAHKRRKNKQKKESQWTFNIIREIPITTAHIASIRCVQITPIITPNVVQ